MVPLLFHDYFVASTGAGAALVGLLFVAVSIAPERTVTVNAPLERRAMAGSAYTALLNAFFISLGALIPEANLAWVTLVMSLVGLLHSLLLGWDLFKDRPKGWLSHVRRTSLILIALVFYSLECYYAIQMFQRPNDNDIVITIAALLLGVYALGLTRAWQLLGARSYRISELLSPLRDLEEK